MQARRLRSIDCWNEWWRTNSTHNSWALFEVERKLNSSNMCKTATCIRARSCKDFLWSKTTQLKILQWRSGNHPTSFQRVCLCLRSSKTPVFLLELKKLAKERSLDHLQLVLGLVFTVHILHLIIAIKASLENAHALPRRQRAKLKGAPRLKSCRKGHSGQIRGFAPI